MGSGYMFRSDTSSLGLGFDNYLGFYTVWTVGTVHYKVNNNIFTQNLFDNLSAIDIDLWHIDKDITRYLTDIAVENHFKNNN